MLARPWSGPEPYFNTRAFISMAADLSTFVPGGKAAKTVKAAYGVGSVTAETATKAIVGEKVDYLKSGTSVLKAGAPLITSSDAGKFLIKTNAIKADIVISALRDDNRSVKKGAVQYTKELTTFSLDALKKSGPDKASAFVSVASSAFEYHEALNKAFDEHIANQFESADRYMNAKANFRRLAARLQKQIDAADAIIQSCSSTDVPLP